jgi:hypothetical protein
MNDYDRAERAVWKLEQVGHRSAPHPQVPRRTSHATPRCSLPDGHI